MPNPQPEQPFVPVTFAEMSDSDKLTYLCEHVSYLSQTVTDLLTTFSSNPMMRMMIGRKQT